MFSRSFFPNFGQGPFPKIAGKGPDNKSSFVVNSGKRIKEKSQQEILVLMAYVQRPSLNDHTDVSSGAIDLIFSLSPPLFFMLEGKQSQERSCISTGSSEPSLLNNLIIEKNR